MSGRRVAHAVVLLTLASSAAYLFVYLYRWEWNRALIAGVFVLASELGLVAAALSARLRAIEARLDAQPSAPERLVAQRLRAAAPPTADHFAWLRSSTQHTSVFVPVLLGAGVVLSALAWLVERLARLTAGAALERGLAARLAVLSLPPEPLVDPRGEEALSPTLTVLLRPVPRSDR
ncbi:MAG: hypothetical protein ACRD2W_05500 [Acidimicrobiales bacterium]